MSDDVRTETSSYLRARWGIARDTVEVVREKQLGDVAVVGVIHERSPGRRVHELVGFHRRDGTLWRQSGGWSSGAREVAPDTLRPYWGGWSAGGSRPPAQPPEARGSEARTRGVWGGWIADHDVVSVRLIDRDGRVVHDDVEAGVAILIWTHPFTTRDARAEFLDCDARVLHSEPM